MVRGQTPCPGPAPPMIDGTALLTAIAPKTSRAKAERQRRIIAVVGPALVPTVMLYGIEWPLRLAHFVAQLAHESDGFSTTEEYATGSAYEGRRDLGNVNPGDGRRYKGRGLIQLTGRANYRTYGTLLHLNLEGQPEIAADPVTSLRIACEYWRQKKLNVYADADDVLTITRRINGGTNGLTDRKAYLAKAKRALGLA